MSRPAPRACPAGHLLYGDVPACAECAAAAGAPVLETKEHGAVTGWTAEDAHDLNVDWSAGRA